MDDFLCNIYEEMHPSIKNEKSCLALMHSVVAKKYKFAEKGSGYIFKVENTQLILPCASNEVHSYANQIEWQIGVSLIKSRHNC